MQYFQLLQNLDIILKKINDIHGLRFFYNVAKKTTSKREQEDLEFLESTVKPFFDPYSETRQMFTQWTIQSDVYVSTSRFDKNIFLKRFLTQRDKVRNEFDKIKLDSTKLAEKIVELRIYLEALENHGTRVPILTKQESLPKLDSTIILEKGKPFDVLKEVSMILSKSKKYVKIMDKYVSDRTLEFLISSPDISVQLLTSVIEPKKITQFHIMLRRINEQRTNKIFVKKSEPTEFHDRFIITDENLWIIGSSLKDVGYTNWSTLTKVQDEEKRNELNRIFDQIWEKSMFEENY